jgi:hypothetical protein
MREQEEEKQKERRRKEEWQTEIIRREIRLKFSEVLRRKPVRLYLLGFDTNTAACNTTKLKIS